MFLLFAPEKTARLLHLMLLGDGPNWLVLQRGNLLMLTAVLTLVSSIAFWIFQSILHCSAVRVWHLLLMLITCRLCTTASFGCFCAHLTELQNILARWRQATLICFSVFPTEWLLTLAPILWMLPNICLSPTQLTAFISGPKADVERQKPPHGSLEGWRVFFFFLSASGLRLACCPCRLSRLDFFSWLLELYETSQNP